MISPTGQGIRNDSEGSGYYGARRGSRFHKGTDYLATPGQPIVAPFDMVLDRYSKPSDKPLIKNFIILKFAHKSGVKWSTPSGSGRMWYFTPIPELIGTFVSEGTEIGHALDLNKFYHSRMLSHIHFQINSFDPEYWKQLTELINKYQI